MPKQQKDNLLWRQELRNLAVDDTDIQSHLLTACSQSFLFWCNAFVWTYRQKKVDDKGNDIPVLGPEAHVPFITWPVQDEAIEQMLVAIKKGEDINFEKSRDMGASWLMLAFADWYFLFTESANIGAVSRKEELVDKQGNMDSLFEKIRYINNMLPNWMVPKIRDTYMFMNNLEIGSTIAGESTNSDVGRGGRKTFYIVDEAAAIRNAEDVEHSLSQNTACQIWVSTPHGPNTQFHKRIKEKRGKLIQLAWWRHPEKAAHAYQTIDESGRVRWTSPWYEKQQAKFSKKTIAQEIDMDHGQAGDMFFDYTELERHKQDHMTPPVLQGRLKWKGDLTHNEQVERIQQMDNDAVMFIAGKRKAPWRFWVDLIDGRLPQYWTYVFGIDISNGSGNSNSVISVMALEIGQIVAKFWDAHTSPEDLAMEAAIAGVWIGGLNPPAFVAWENNGPGGIFGRKFVTAFGYPRFYRQRQEGTKQAKKSPRWGWNSNNDRKEIVLGMYRDALSRDDLINPCQESLEEAADYIYEDGGQLIPAVLREEASGGRKLHGDHVIADALCWLAKQELPEQQKAQPRAPKGSYAYRRQRAKIQEKQNDPWRN